MNFVHIEKRDDLVVLRLERGKVNAFTPEVVRQLKAGLKEVERDPGIRAVILTGTGKFFSFGFDVPHFLSYSKTEFTDYLTLFTGLYTDLFLYPKPVIAALNGHAIAGGCMLALACDRRIMILDHARISLNEINFGASVFAGSAEMLRFRVGSALATDVLYSGKMYTSQEAVGIGLVDKIADPGTFMDVTLDTASDLGAKPPRAFASIKKRLRGPVAEKMKAREASSIKEFVDIWYDEPAWTHVQEIKIF